MSQRARPRLRFASKLSEHLNFFRIHLLFFIFTPLIASAVFYASRKQDVNFIDALFICVSSMTVTGLS